MDKDPKYFIIGLAFIFLLLGLAAFLLWTSSYRKGADRTLYGIYFKDHSLSGLQVDGLVTMRGIKVGSVKEVAFHPEDVERVLVEILIEAETPVKTDTRAVVNRNLLTGLASIDLVDSTQSAPYLRDTTRAGELPIIPEGKTDLAQLQNTLPEILDEANKVLRQIDKIFSDDNAENISRVLSNMEVFSKELAEHSKDIGEALSAVSSASISLAEASEQVAKGVRLVLKRVDRIVEGSSSLISKAGARLEQIGSSASDIAVTVRQGKESLFGPTEVDLLRD